MIPAHSAPRQPAGQSRPSEQASEADWHRLLAQGYREVGALLQDLSLSAEELAEPVDPATPFPLRVPRGYVARMRPGDPTDPLLRQVLPLDRENDAVPGYVNDPVGDLDSRQSAGVLHKYPGRALLVTTGACAIHCRYCFRRHFPYGEENAGRKRWRNSLEAVAADDSIREVILSGGDPLSLDNDKLRPLIEGLGKIAHVERLRIHTRLPVVLPERIDPELVALLTAFPGPVCLVIHANHAQELDESVARALGPLREAGVLLLNQAVLLKGVNDSVSAQEDLSARLTALAVAPYYLHQLDPVAGAAHFQVSDHRARTIIDELRRLAPGYMVPRLVQEIPGDQAKRPL
ncbi:EF-P beta-lysylation protein EpmB [Gammaproteobacteria bacterium AB-CW1]|uniref:L-lysine 2,3-aminomutase n=1 Tax=Natronospira elongata TaxID=3110268 RepID=A0AAP6MLW7_9GAMM|nr:EF-P beta-lysylation protein EpmB [Gammaproteobacteria bacterium AB-CW1]